MKWKMILTSMIVMLLPPPAQAKKVYLALLDYADLKSINNEEGLDELIKSSIHNPRFFFQSGNLQIGSDQELIMRGGRGGIKRTLEPFSATSITVPNGTTVSVFGCHVVRLLRESATYVEIRPSDFRRPPFCDNQIRISPPPNSRLYLATIGRYLLRIGDHKLKFTWYAW